MGNDLIKIPKTNNSIAAIKKIKKSSIWTEKLMKFHCKFVKILILATIKLV